MGKGKPHEEVVRDEIERQKRLGMRDKRNKHAERYLLNDEKLKEVKIQAAGIVNSTFAKFFAQKKKLDDWT